MLHVQGQREEIDIISLHDHLLHGRIRAAHLNDFRAVGESLADLFQEIARLHAKGERKPTPAGHDIADELLTRRSVLLEQDRPVAVLQYSRDISERYLARMYIELAHASEFFEEAAQAKMIVVHGQTQ
jgi:hypothetical protein